MTMAKIKSSNPVRYTIQNNTACIAIDNPPVNALSTPVRAGLLTALKECIAATPQWILIYGESNTFIAGADIKELEQEPLPSPTLPEVIDAMLTSPVPIIAALQGNVLGGGFEIALAASYRIAHPKTKIGFPETNLGLVPGSGGTQHITRLVPFAKAVDMVCHAKIITASEAKELTIIDSIIEGDDLYTAATKFADTCKQPRNISTITPTGFDEAVYISAQEAILEKYPHHQAQQQALTLLKQSFNLPYKDGREQERATFLNLRFTQQSKALRHVFFAERSVAKPKQKNTVASVLILGAGTMGRNIAFACAQAKITTTLVDLNQDTLTHAQTTIESTLSKLLSRNKISEQHQKSTLEHLTITKDNPTTASEPDCIIEAVVEKTEVKKSIFTSLATTYPNALLASNTSYLNLYDIFSDCDNKQRTLGLHFFNPADRMKLLEIVLLDHSSNEAKETALSLAHTLRKVPILVGSCFGFAANRLYTAYNRENNLMLLEGVTPTQIDYAYRDFGMAMGPMEVLDLSGIDVGFQGRSQNPNPPNDPTYFAAINALAHNNYLGVKTQKGFYHYENGKKSSEHDDALSLIKQKAAELHITPKTTSHDDIPQRGFSSVQKEAELMLKEGIIQSMDNVDLIWIYGYGFPRVKGGPIFNA